MLHCRPDCRMLQFVIAQAPNCSVATCRCMSACKPPILENDCVTPTRHWRNILKKVITETFFFPSCVKPLPLEEADSHRRKIRWWALRRRNACVFHSCQPTHRISENLSISHCKRERAGPGGPVAGELKTLANLKLCKTLESQT